MTNKKLQALCFFAFIVGTVINWIKCETRKDCCTEIFQTNKMIMRLNDEQKYTLITQSLEEFKYDKIIEVFYPRDVLLLTGRIADDPVYRAIIENEYRIQRKIFQIIESVPVHYDITDIITSSYNKEVAKRGNILNLTFRMVLNEKMKHVKMCKNGEHLKCELVGLIKRTTEYRMRYEARCDENNDGSCVITPKEWLLPDTSFKWTYSPKELYKDIRFDTRNMTYYKTYLFDQKRGLIPWQYDVPPIDEQSDSEET